MRPVNDNTLSSKERAFLEAARRELAAKAPRSEAIDAGPSGSAAVLPLDVPTAAGRDQPAAQGASPELEGDKWARIAALMETERREAEARRRRMRRNGLTVVAFLVIILLIAFARALIR
jgi:hypothetical protein